MITLLTLIVNVLILLLGALCLKWIAGGIVKSEKSKSFGRALGIMIIWVLLDFVFTYFGINLMLGFWMILIYWLLFGLLCVLVYSCGFGQGLGIALLLAILVFVLVIILVAALTPILLAIGLSI
ncbi:MAG: hypothetical protein ACTSUE_08685 [Promethearchaeota archaeon]